MPMRARARLAHLYPSYPPPTHTQTFMIERGTNTCGFESDLVAGTV